MTGSSRWEEFSPGDGEWLQTALEQDRAYFEETFGYPPGAEAQSLMYAVPDGRSSEDKYILLWRETPLAEPQGIAEVIPHHPEDGTWSVGFFFVTVPSRRRGIGRRSARDLLAWLAERGAAVARCSPAADQAVTVAFTKALGFEQTGATARRLGNRDHSLLILTRRVGSAT